MSAYSRLETLPYISVIVLYLYECYIGISMEMKSKISLASVVFFLGLLAISQYHYNCGQQFGSQIVLTLAGAMISIPVTLFIIENVIKWDREQQLKIEKLHTCEAILFIVTRILDRIIEVSLPSSHTKFAIREIIIKGWKNPNASVSNTIKETSNLIKRARDEKRANSIKRIRSGYIEDWKKESDKENKLMLKFSRSISLWLKELRDLVPKILILYGDKNLYENLSEFEKLSLIFEDFSVGYYNELPIFPIDQLYERCSMLYDVIMEYYENDEGNLV